MKSEKRKKERNEENKASHKKNVFIIVSEVDTYTKYEEKKIMRETKEDRKKKNPHDSSSYHDFVM